MSTSLKARFRFVLAGPRRWRLAAGTAGALVVVGLLILLIMVGAEEDLTWERIQETGILRVCTDPSWPPFETYSNATGQIEGFDADLARLLARRLVIGGRAALVTVGFDGLYDALLSGRCDAVLSALPYEPARTEDVAYSLAYFNAGQVLVVAEQSSGITSVEDLPGRLVGVEWGFVPEGEPRRRFLLGSLTTRRYDSPTDLLRALQAGEIEAALVDRVSALAYLRQCRGLRIVGEPITDVEYAIPVRPDCPLLLERINSILLEMRRDGTLADLQSRWF